MFSWIVQGAHKLSEDFAKPYFHKYWTEIHDVTTIWKRNVCSVTVTLNALDVHPQSGTSHKTCLTGFGRNGSITWTSAVSHVGRTSNAFKVTMKLQTFLFQMVLTSCISVQYLSKYGFAKFSDNLYAPCIFMDLKSKGRKVERWMKYKIPLPCWVVGAVVSVTTTVMRTTAAMSLSNSLITATSPDVLSTAKKPCIT